MKLEIKINLPVILLKTFKSFLYFWRKNLSLPYPKQYISTQFNNCYILLELVIFLIITSFTPSTLNSQPNFQEKLKIQQIEEAPVKLIPFPKEVIWENREILISKLKVGGNSYPDDEIVNELSKLCSENNIQISDNQGIEIIFSLNEEISKEGYQLRISDETIFIEASDNAGRFYALQTLRQLILVRDNKSFMQLCTIKDKPQYSFRGYMVDVGRNFQSIDLLKQQIDIMARYKLNIFQWHLTDRPAWRIESKAFPELTDARNHRQSRNPGKHYTYDDIRTLFKYAKSKQIQIIPEIDMPGHSDSFVTSTGYKMESKEGMEILSKVLDEFFSEIPVDLCPIIHIGSDEVKIENPENFLNQIINICTMNQRKVMVWNPGLSTNQNVIKQTWRADHIISHDNFEIDSWNSYINNGDPFVHISKLFFKPIGHGSPNKILGGILCVWHDVNQESEDDFLKYNPVYPSMLTYAWKTWTEDFKLDTAFYLTRLPDLGTRELSYFSAFESYLMEHKNKYFENHHFQYFPQSQTVWKLTGPFENSNKEISLEDIRKYLQDAHSCQIAVGNTIYIRDRFKLGGHFPKAMPGETYYARTFIHSSKDQSIPVWIGFETAFRANRVYSGIAELGQWDANGGNIWVNDKEIPPAEWQNPGWKPSKISGWGSIEDQEIPWNAEEFYWTRPPLYIALKKGWNEVMIKVPGTHEYQNWMFTFAPLDTTDIRISIDIQN